MINEILMKFSFVVCYDILRIICYNNHKRR
jgi:hypothetical protein